MGFPPAEVAEGVNGVMRDHGVETCPETGADRWVFRAGPVTITVEPLPSGRPTSGLFHPRTLLVLTGEGTLAQALKRAIRLKFLRVTG